MQLPIAFIAALLISVHCYGQSAQQLIDRYDRAVTSKNYAHALNAAESITDRYPESATWRFQLGSMQVRMDQIDSALESLHKAADLGYTGVRSFEQSEDLDPLRDDDRFIKILERVRSNAQARLDEFIVHAKNHKPKVYLPDSAGDSPPLILALHGTGMSGDDMIQVLQDVSEELGMILIAPDALRPANSGGYSWTYRDESEWLVESMIDRAVEQYQVDRSKVYLVGFSQGANIALTMGQTHPELFAGVVPICGHYEPQLTTAVNDAELPPFYLMTGSRDPWKKTYISAKRDFKEIQAPVQVRLLSGKGHELPSGTRGVQELIRAIQWCQDQHGTD